MENEILDVYKCPLCGGIFNGGEVTWLDYDGEFARVAYCPCCGSEIKTVDIGELYYRRRKE